jgi:hypothetical protein
MSVKAGQAQVTKHFDVIAQDMPQARPFLDL